MEFLKNVFGDKALTFADFKAAIEADKNIKLANLADGKYVDKDKLDKKTNELTEAQDTDNNALNELEEKLLATPDSMLIPAERSVNQKIILKRENSTRLASAYGRDVKSLIEYANENDGFLYQSEDTKKVRQLLARNGLQLPTPLKLSDSDINVPQNDTVVNNNISSVAENYSENSTTDGESEESRETFRQPSTKEIYRKETAEEQMNTIIGKHENTTQRHLKDVAEKLGVKLRWDNNCSRGYYDPETNTIVMNPIWSITKSYYTLFKHEFVHYLETKKGYAGFKSYLINHSKAFYEYVRGKLEQRGVEFTGGREEALAAYTDIVLKERQAAEEIPYRIRKGYNTEKIHREIIADFVGDVLLGGNSIAKAEQALMEIAETNRTLLQKFKDWLRDIISLLKREPRNRTLAEDLEYLNQRIARVYDSAQKRNASKGERKYSLNIKHTDGTIEKLADAHNLTNEQAIIYLNQAKRGELQGHSYIPVRKDTPQVLIDTLENAGEKVENLSLIMQVRKVQQAMSTKNNGSKSKHGNNVRSHALSAGEIVEILNNLDYPNEIILQTNRHNQYGEELPNNVAVFVEYNNDNKEGMAVIEFESSIDPQFIGKEFGDTNFHTVVTVFEPDTERNGMAFDYAEELLQNPDNFELDIVRRQPERSATQEKHPNTSNELSSSDIIDDIASTVNSKSMQKSENNSSDKSWSVASPEFTTEMNKLTEAVKGGEISVDEFVKRVNELAENEQKVSGDLRKALAEQEEKHWDYVIDNARYNNQLKKRIKRQNEQLAKTRAEISAEITAQREERASKQKNIEHIRKTVSRIDKMFRTNSNTKHIPEELKDAVAYFVRIFIDNQ